MSRTSGRRTLVTFVFGSGLMLAIAAASPVTRASAAGATFGTPVTLPSSTGGEPSISVDTSNCTSSSCYVYVTSPNATSSGPAVWASSNAGASFGSPVPIDNVLPCGTLRGGDTDVDTMLNGSVSATDLDVSTASVQLSNTHAAPTTTGNFSDSCTVTAPEDDRPWLAHQGSSTIYVAYHDFVLEVPIVCTSTTASGTNPGTFACVQAFGTSAHPGGTGTQLSNCAENTVPARALVVDPTDSSLNFMYSCSTTAENVAHPPYGPLHDYYLARSTNGVTYTTQTVFQCSATSTVCPTGSGQAPNLANIFGTLASDSAGNYYALFDGTVDDNTVLQHPDHVYLTVSKDKGATWSRPVVVDHEGDGLGTHTLAHMAVTTPGNVDIVWYGTTSTGEPNGQCGSTGAVHTCTEGGNNVGMDHEDPTTHTNTGGPVAGNWQVSMAQTTDALCQLDATPCATPTFTQALVDPNYRHFGTICSNGIVCGGVSDRHLLDFTSVAVDCAGLAHVTYGADQNTATAPAIGNAARADGPLNTIVTNQTGGTAIAAPATCPLAMVTPETPLVPLLPAGAAMAGAAVWLARRAQRRSASR